MGTACTDAEPHLGQVAAGGGLVTVTYLPRRLAAWSRCRARNACTPWPRRRNYVGAPILPASSTARLKSCCAATQTHAKTQVPGKPPPRTMPSLHRVWLGSIRASPTVTHRVDNRSTNVVLRAARSRSLRRLNSLLASGDFHIHRWAASQSLAGGSANSAANLGRNLWELNDVQVRTRSAAPAIPSTARPARTTPTRASRDQTAMLQCQRYVRIVGTRDGGSDSSACASQLAAAASIPASRTLGSKVPIGLLRASSGSLIVSDGLRCSPRGESRRTAPICARRQHPVRHGCTMKGGCLALLYPSVLSCP